MRKILLVGLIGFCSNLYAANQNTGWVKITKIDNWVIGEVLTVYTSSGSSVNPAG